MYNASIRRYFRHGTLTQMRVFEAVARHGNFTRAAEELHMAQPTVSVHVKKLTETIGVALLEQVGRRARLTAAGEETFAACRRIFDAVVGLDDALTDICALKAGKLRIAATTAGECLMPQLLAQFVKRHPAIEVSLHVGPRQGIIERLAKNADDLYLLTAPPASTPVAAHPILPNPLVALASADHPLAGEQKIPFERFAREPLLMREQGSGTRLAAEDAYAKHGLVPRVRMELGSNETIKEAVIAGLGVALVYRSALGFSFDAHRLAILDVEGVPCGGHWHFVHPLAKQLPSIAQTFVEFACAEAVRIFDEHVARRAQVGEAREALRTAA
jgi:LysR family transcriptional regulator, low CO2-responsive transcriptional regulator